MVKLSSHPVVQSSVLVSVQHVRFLFLVECAHSSPTGSVADRFGCWFGGSSRGGPVAGLGFDSQPPLRLFPGVLRHLGGLAAYSECAVNRFAAHFSCFPSLLYISLKPSILLQVPYADDLYVPQPRQPSTLPMYLNALLISPSTNTHHLRSLVTGPGQDIVVAAHQVYLRIFTNQHNDLAQDEAPATTSKRAMNRKRRTPIVSFPSIGARQKSRRNLATMLTDRRTFATHILLTWGSEWMATKGGRPGASQDFVAQ